MSHNILRWISGTALLVSMLVLPEVSMGAGPKTFAFVNSRYAITVEIASEHKFVLNFINFSDFVVVLQPNELIYRGASGRYYIGQVFDLETKTARGESQKYYKGVVRAKTQGDSCARFFCSIWNLEFGSG